MKVSRTFNAALDPSRHLYDVETEAMQRLLTAFKLAFNYVNRHPHEFLLQAQTAQEELLASAS